MKMSYEKVLRLMIKNTRKNLEELSGLVEIVRLMLNAWNRRWGSRGGVGCETRRESILGGSSSTSLSMMVSHPTPPRLLCQRQDHFSVI